MRFQSTHLCPCCNNLLSYEDDGSGRFVSWCSVGRCPSERGDRGAIGDTPEEAAESLIKAMKEEGDWLLE